MMAEEIDTLEFFTKPAVPTGEGNYYSFSPLIFTVFSRSLTLTKYILPLEISVYFREQNGFIGLIVLSLAFVERKYPASYKLK